MLIPFELNGLWGYMNSEKKVIVEPQFDEAFLTFNLIGRIKKNGKFGYINNEGKIIVKPKYDYAEDFNHGVAKVQKGKDTHVINTEGKKNKVFYPTCGHHAHFSSPIIITDSLIASKRYSYIQKMFLNSILQSTDSVYDIKADLFIIRKMNKFAMIEGWKIFRNIDSLIKNIQYQYDSIKYFECCDNRGIKDHIGIRKNERWGFCIFEIGLCRIIEPVYLGIEAFENDFARVEFEPNRFGYIDLQNKEYFYRSK